MIHNYISEATVLAHSSPPLTFDDYNRIERSVSREFRWYLIGLICSFFQSDKSDNNLTRAQVAQNSGYAEETMKRFMCYVNSVNRLQQSFPDLVSDILAGKTRLGLKTTILLAKQSPNDIAVIIKRVETENTPIRRIISDQIKHPLTYPRRFSDGRSTKSSPKSIKDTPRYDPDAQITGLIYTIPSWIKAIERVHMNEDICNVSHSARNKLRDEFLNLKSVTEALIKLIKGAT